jgi:hypothetical protein
MILADCLEALMTFGFTKSEGSLGLIAHGFVFDE